MKITLRTYLILPAISLLLFSCLEERNKIEDDPFLGKPGARMSVGQSGNFILSDERFTRLNIEIAYMTGTRPTQEMVDNMVGFLQEMVHKPEGIFIVEKAITNLDQETYSVEDIRGLEEEHREFYNEGNSLSFFLLVVDGYLFRDEEESMALGAAYQNTSMVLFGKRIEENSGGFSRPSKGVLESTVVLHEMGHLLGLVNLGSEMEEPHEDESYESHCDNSDCLMYWAVETGNVVNFMGTTIPSLDQKCRNDLMANGGR
ncbi:MAG: hypothetical protein WD398_09380 [Cyclobacteriaceae bacterium]